MDELTSFLRGRQKINLLIVIVNAAVFVVLSFLGNPESAEFMLDHGACYAPLVTEAREYYRLASCMFLHFSLQHLINNMLVLIFLGDTLELIAGKIRYLLIYLGGGIAGNMLSVLWNTRTGDYAVSAGASGGVFAVIGALICIVLLDRDRRDELSGRRLVFMAVLSILQGLTSMGIDNTAHIGGLIGGFLIAFVTGAGRKWRQ